MKSAFALCREYSRSLRGYTFPLATGILSDLTATFLTMIPPLFAILIFDYAYPNRDLRLVTGAVLAGLVLYFVNFIFSSINDYLNCQIDGKIGTDLSTKLFGKILHLPLKDQSRRNIGDLTVRTLEDADIATGLVVNSPQVLIINLAALGIFLTISLRLDPYVTLLSLASIPFYLFETHFFSGRLEQLQKDSQTSQAATIDALQERLANIRTVKAFGQEGFEQNRFASFLNRRLHLGIKQRVVSFFSAFTNSMTLQIWSTFVAWYMGYEVVNGRLSIGQLIALTTYLPQVAGPIHELANLYTNWRVGMVSLRRVDEILSLPSEEPMVAGDRVPIEQGHVSLQRLSFAYEPFTPVLRDLSLEVRPRSSLALVGASGSGKSTLINLLLRFYHPDSGMILIDGHEVRQMHVTSLRSQIAVVFQEISLFAGTIRENILYGALEPSEATLIESSKLAAAHDFIARLPRGYDSMVEPFGHNLSGGEKQRIAIARALVRKPKVLILDEAASALDAESEFIVQETVERCQRQMTVILVAHRFSSIKGVDQIVVLEGGRIVERGSFSELLARKGVFFTLYHLQSGGFQEFQQRLQIEFARYERYRQDLSLIHLAVNEYDHYRHREKVGRIGRLMEELNLSIRRFLRIMDFSSVYRENGILICLPQTALDDARIFALRLSKNVRAAPLEIDGKSFGLTVTPRLASCRQDSPRFAEDLIEKVEENQPLHALEGKVLTG